MTHHGVVPPPKALAAAPHCARDDFLQVEGTPQRAFSNSRLNYYTLDPGLTLSSLFLVLPREKRTDTLNERSETIDK